MNAQPRHLSCLYFRWPPLPLLTSFSILLSFLRTCKKNCPFPLFDLFGLVSLIWGSTIELHHVRNPLRRSIIFTHTQRVINIPISISVSLWSRKSTWPMAIRTESPQIRESGFRNPWNFCFWNLSSRALDSEIQLRESGIPLRNGI